MHLRSALLSIAPLLVGGCLARDISRTIDQVHCGGDTGTGAESGTGSGTADCPDTTGDTAGGDTMIQTSTDGPGDSDSDSDSTDASSSGSMEGSSSTGAPTTVCGDGVVEEGEECDDGNDVMTDGCGNCGRARRVFITSEDYRGNSFNGLVGADQRCRSRAQTAGLANFGGFKAWLSDSKISAGERMFNGRGPYVLVNGLVVVESWGALLAGELQNPINVTEASETKEYQVWTGTMPDGTAAVGADFCADWSADQFKNRAFWGRSEYITSDWTIVKGPVDQPGDSRRGAWRARRRRAGRHGRQGAAAAALSPPGRTASNARGGAS